MVHEDLTAHLEYIWCLAHEAFGNVVNSAQISGDILTHLTIAPGRALHEDAVLIAQGGGQTVDLWFRHYFHDGVIIQFQKAPDTG